MVCILNRRYWVLMGKPSLVKMANEKLQYGAQKVQEWVKWANKDLKRRRRTKKQFRYLIRFLRRQDLCDLFLRLDDSRDPREIKKAPEIKRGQVARLFQSWGFKGAILDEVVEHMTQNDGHWADLLVANDLKLQPVEENGLLGDSILVGVSAVVGSFIPLWPFFFFPPETAIWLGLLCTAVTLYAVGVIKAKLTVGKPSRSGLQMLVIGMLAALVGYVIGLFFAL